MVQQEQSQERLPIERLPAPAIEFLGVIESGINRGLNKREIQAEIAAIREARGERAAGIKDTYLTQARNFLAGQPFGAERPADQRFTNKDKMPDVRRMRQSEGPILRQFSHTVAIVDCDTGQVFGYVTVSTDRQLTIGAIENQAKQSIDSTGIEAYAEEELEDYCVQVVESLQASETIL